MVSLSSGRTNFGSLDAKKTCAEDSKGFTSWRASTQRGCVVVQRSRNNLGEETPKVVCQLQVTYPAVVGAHANVIGVENPLYRRRNHCHRYRSCVLRFMSIMKSACTTLACMSEGITTCIPIRSRAPSIVATHSILEYFQVCIDCRPLCMNSFPHKQCLLSCCP